MNQAVFDAILKHCQNNGYGSTMMKWNDEIANEIYNAIKHLVEASPATTKQDEYVTIGGVKYKLEELKK